MAEIYIITKILSLCMDSTRCAAGMSECLVIVISLRPNEDGNCVLVQGGGQGRLLRMWKAEIAMRSK